MTAKTSVVSQPPAKRKRRSANKRGNGEGAIYQRGDTGKWCAVVTREGASRKYVYGNSHQEVVEKLASVQRDVQLGMPLPKERLTLEHYLKDWLATTVTASRRAGTYLRYETACRVHISPVIGKVKLAKLTPQHVQKVQTRMLQAGKSPATIRLVRACLCSALTQAEKFQLVARNVVKFVDNVRDDADEPEPLTPEQAAALLRTLQGHEFEQLFTTMLATGLRIGEALGLTWANVESEHKRLHVRQQLTEIPGKPRQFSEPKSKSGKRTVPLIPDAITALRAQRARYVERKLHLGSAWQDLDLVFADESGGFLVSRRVERVFKQLCERAGLAATFTPHALRHSTGTYLTASGVPDRVIMQLLGHSSLDMTRRYQHVMSSMMHDAADRLAANFPSASAAAEAV
jgi:integrase